MYIFLQMYTLKLSKSVKLKMDEMLQFTKFSCLKIKK